MHYNLIFLSGDAKLIQRLEAALSGDCAVLSIDPRAADDETAARFQPHGIVIDAGAHSGAKTMLERMAAVRARFAGLPLIAVGDEMSAQVILSAFRAGVDDFVDRDASDGELRNAVLSRLRDRTKASDGTARLVNILSPAPSDEDSDLALNIASMIAASSDECRVLLLDLSLPVTPARTALGLEFSFTLSAALRDMARLDRTFLDSALARAGDSGLYVLPLTDDENDAALPAPRELAVLLQILRSLFDTIVVHWGAFSRQAVRAGVVDGAVFVGCNQRFSSVRNAKSFLAVLRAADISEPFLAIHQLDANLVPSAADIAEAVGAGRSLILRAGWNVLALAHNRGRPLGLMPPSPYGDALRLCLAQAGLLPRSGPENATGKLLQWLHLARAG